MLKQRALPTSLIISWQENNIRVSVSHLPCLGSSIKKKMSVRTLKPKTLLVPRHGEDCTKRKHIPHIVFFFLSFILFIYLFILFLAVLGPRFCARAFPSCSKWGPLFIAVRGPLTIAASLVAEHKLQTRRLSSCGS